MSQAEIAAVNHRFEAAVRKGDIDGMAALYTPGAMVLPPDGPVVKGRENIKQLWGTVVSQMGLKDVKLETLDLQIAGDTAYEVGEATLSLEPKGGKPTTAVAKYVVVWRKVDGQWRLHRDIWNTKGS